VFLLASSVIGVGSMALVATHDPSFSTEPDYYQKAVHWDQVQAQAAQNQRLSYQLSLPQTLTPDAGRRASIELVVRDHAGQPVSGARVRAEAFSNLAASEITTLDFVERAPGRYETTLATSHLGVWDFRVSADRDADHFTAELRSELVPRGTP
jgi:uncharacterized GH25 family protein